MVHVIHRPQVSVESTSVGARWRTTCSVGDFTTPLLSQEAAESARELHEWETET